MEQQAYFDGGAFENGFPAAEGSASEVEVRIGNGAQSVAEGTVLITGEAVSRSGGCAP